MKRMIKSTPLKDGFYMPGEFEPHEGCWMIWPERNDNWRMGARPAQAAFVAVAKAIIQFEPLTMLVSNRQFNNAKRMLPEDVRVIEMTSNDAWIRDCGPTFVVNGNGEVRGVDWDFNAWGGLYNGLYFPWDQDDRIAEKICEIERKARYKPNGFILEGGSIHADGEGTIIATKECLLDEGRNTYMSKDEIENCLLEYLGAKKVVWLKNGIYNDETNGTVDNICCFVKPGTVFLAWTDDQNDPQYEISAANYDILTKATDAKGRKLEVVKMPLPKPVLLTKEESDGVDAEYGTLPRNEGDRMAASYINFYIANGGIIFPLYGDPADKQAEMILKDAFPDRKVVGVYAREILLGGGAIHCITQQQPL